MQQTEKALARRFGQPGGNKPGRPKGRGPKLTAERVETELARIALFDPIHIFRREGKEGPDARFRVRDLAQMPEDTRRCISRMRIKLVKGEKISKTERLPDEEVLEIWFHDKVKALELCAKHFGWVTTKATMLVGKELRAMLEEGRQRNAAFAARRLEAIDVTPSRALAAAAAAEPVTMQAPPVTSAVPVPPVDPDEDEDEAADVVI